MEAKESLERIDLGLCRAASCCRELAVLNDATEWKDLSAQLLLMRKKALAIYNGTKLSEGQIQGLLSQMEMAQKLARGISPTVN